MTLCQYQELSFDERADEWSNNGHFLASRVEGIYAVNLYALHDFHVEAYYNTHTNRIEQLWPLRSAAELEPYLIEISIEKMLAVCQKNSRRCESR